ncbi:unnamed protein product, partial [Ixodes pacificus]
WRRRRYATLVARTPPPPIGGVAIRRRVVLVKSRRHKTFTTDDAATADALEARICATLRQMEPLGCGRHGGCGVACFAGSDVRRPEADGRMADSREMQWP